MKHSIDRRTFLKYSALLFPFFLCRKVDSDMLMVYSTIHKDKPVATPVYVETFEGNEVDSDSTAGYDNAGGIATGPVVDPNYLVFEDFSKMLRLRYVAAESSYKTPQFTLSGEGWYYFELYFTSYSSPASDVKTIQILNASSVEVAAVFITTGDKFKMRVGNSFSAGSTGSFDVSTCTEYCSIWLYYKPGTGADALGQLYASTSVTKPGSPDIDITDGDGGAVTDAGYMRFKALNTNATRIYFDNIFIDDEIITGDPLGNAPQ